MPIADNNKRLVNEGFSSEAYSYNQTGLDLTSAKWSGEMPHWRQPHQEHFEGPHMQRQHNNSCPSNYQGTNFGQRMFHPQWIGGFHFANQFYDECIKKLAHV